MINVQTDLIRDRTAGRRLRLPSLTSSFTESSWSFTFFGTNLRMILFRWCRDSYTGNFLLEHNRTSLKPHLPQRGSRKQSRGARHTQVTYKRHMTLTNNDVEIIFRTQVLGFLPE
jgi:hypothetical protein